MTYLEMESIISTVSSRILGHRYGNSLSTLLTVTKVLRRWYISYMDCLATDNTFGHSLLVLIKAHPTSVPVPNLVGHGYYLCGLQLPL